MDGRAHFQSLTQTVFEGATGNVSFDPITGTRQDARFGMTNIQIDPERSNETHVAFKQVTTSILLGDNFITTPEGPSIFNDGSTTVPSDLPQPTLDDNYVSIGLQAAGWTMCAVIVLMALSASVWVMIHSNHRVVLAAQPIFLHIFLTGVMVIATSIVPLSIDEGTAETSEGCDTACQSFPWLLCIGFFLTFSALWAKTNRANRILLNPAFRRMTVSPYDVAKPMLVVLCADVLVLSLWTGLSPLHCETEVLVTDAWGRPIETRGFCTSDDSLWYWIALGVINLGSLVYTVYEAFQARNISTEYAETDYILKSLIFMFLVCFMGIPVLIIAYDNPSAYFFVLSSIIFVVCLSILLLIMAPKIIALHDPHLCANRRDSSGIPSRFSRRTADSSRISGISTSGFHSVISCYGGSSRLAYNSEASRERADGSGEMMGLKIVSHPKTQENLQENNNRLRVQNDELTRRLAEKQGEVGMKEALP